MEPMAGSVCRACRVRIAHSTRGRTFSTSTSRRAVPPESPDYVDVPSSFQPMKPYHPTPKGILPVPREIFPANRPEKATSEYIQNVTKGPLPENVIPPEKLTQMARYKARMSEMRRSQLRESLVSLLDRKQREIQSMATRSEAKTEQRSRLLSQPEREDARLTNVSTPSNMLSGSHASLEALQAELEVARRQHETKLANLAAHTEAAQATSMDALHTLYMSARNFVTTEKQLDDLVRQQFDIATDGSTSHAQFKNDSTTAGSSMWNHGPPQSISDKIDGRANNKSGITNMLGAISGGSAFGSQRAIQRYMGDEVRRKIRNKTKFTKDQERFKKIAEKLSGGKI